MVTLLVAANVGVMVFFAKVAAPLIFKVLPKEWAGTYLRALFPKYFAYLGLTSLLAAFFEPATTLRLALALCAFTFFLSLWLLTPSINRARDTGSQRLFGALHGLSVMLNLSQLVFFVGVL